MNSVACSLFLVVSNLRIVHEMHELSVYALSRHVYAIFAHCLRSEFRMQLRIVYAVNPYAVAHASIMQPVMRNSDVLSASNALRQKYEKKLNMFNFVAYFQRRVLDAYFLRKSTQHYATERNIVLLRRYCVQWPSNTTLLYPIACYCVSMAYSKGGGTYFHLGGGGAKTKRAL